MQWRDDLRRWVLVAQQLVCQFCEKLTGSLIFQAGRLDGALGMEDGGVVAAAEVRADFLKAQRCKFACQVHCDLAGMAD